jgi:hypothetical protein
METLALCLKARCCFKLDLQIVHYSLQDYTEDPAEMCREPHNHDFR